MPPSRSRYGEFGEYLESQGEEVKEEALNVLLHSLPAEDRLAIAHRPEQFIRGCRFASSRQHPVRKKGAEKLFS